MSTYNNLDIAQVTLTFQGPLDPSISSRTFNLSTLAFLPGVPIKDQIEVERIFDTGSDTKFASNVFTIADRREMFIIPKAWYSVDEQTKILTIDSLASKPTFATEGKYYPESRTFKLSNGDTIDIPDFLTNNVQTSTVVGNNTVVRQPDTVIIRRKTLSLDNIVTFAPGTRLTTTQLNLQFNQLKYLVQELMAKVKNEIILKYDENAIDGPFTGGSDLKMSNNYIKDMNSKSITELYTVFPENNISYTGGTFAASVETVYDAITQGTVFRAGLLDDPKTMNSGSFTASNAKITNLANGTADTDAAAFGQIKNASNLTTGTLSNDRLADIPLSKLSSAAGQTFTLPSENLPASTVTAGTYGQSTADNTNNMVSLTVDTKGRVTAATHRSLSQADLPNSGVTAGIYGDSTTPLVQLTVDAKGRVTTVSERAITSSDITSVNADVINSGTIASAILPNVGTAGTVNIPTSITTDAKGRVTSVSTGSIPTTSITNFDTNVRASRLDQMAAPTASVSMNSQKITSVATPTVATDAATKGYVDSYATPQSTFNSSVTSLTQSNAVYWNSGADKFTAQRGGLDKIITGVLAPVSNNDAVNLGYFNANTIAIAGGVINANSNPITNVTMRSGASLADNDAVNYGYVRNLTLYGQAVTDPQTFTNSWPSAGTAASGNKPYEFSLSTLAATTGEMLVVTDSQNRVYVPTSTTPTSAGQYFKLDTTVSPKKVTVYLDSSITPSGSVTIRNFGTSRSVSAATAGATTLGLVKIPTAGGLLIDSDGNTTLNTATASQLGGIKIGTGLSIASGVASVALTDSTSTASSVTAASASAVKSTYDYATSINSSLTTTNTTLTNLSSTVTSVQTTANNALARSGGTMTGKVTTVASSSANASLNIPAGSAPTSPIVGDMWASGSSLMFSNGQSKTIAFTDSSITGNAATATQLSTGCTFSLSTDASGTSAAFNGTSNVTIPVTLNPANVVKTIATTSNNKITATKNDTTGAVTLDLPQNIHTGASPTFAGGTLGNLVFSGNSIVSTGAATLQLSASSLIQLVNNTELQGTLTVAGATALTGAVSVASASGLTLTNGSLVLGSGGQTSVNRQPANASPAVVGDMVLRVPTNGKAYLVANNSNATAAVANDEVITKGALTSALTPYATTASLGSYMSTSGSLATTGDQTIGTQSSNSFIVKTADTARLTINSGGTALFSGGVSTGSNLSVTGTIAATGKITSAATVSGDIDTTVATKGYVDSIPSSVVTSSSATHTVAGNLQNHTIAAVSPVPAVGDIFVIRHSVSGTVGSTNASTAPNCTVSYTIPAGHVYLVISSTSAISKTGGAGILFITSNAASTNGLNTFGELLSNGQIVSAGSLAVYKYGWNSNGTAGATITASNTTTLIRIA